MAFRLRRPLRAFRIAAMRHTIFDGTGAFINGARWNSPGRRVIYAAETFSGAMLEILVHAVGPVPKKHGFVEIEIPSGLLIEELRENDLTGWNSPLMKASRKFGNRWYDERRSAVLIVPSVVSRRERNILINQEHADFTRIKTSPPLPVRWDRRLWQ